MSQVMFIWMCSVLMLQPGGVGADQEADIVLEKFGVLLEQQHNNIGGEHFYIITWPNALFYTSVN